MNSELMTMRDVSIKMEIITKGMQHTEIENNKYQYLTCMCFMMAMEEDPVRSLMSVMAAMIPALYDILDIICCVGLLFRLNNEEGGDEDDICMVRGEVWCSGS